MKHNVCGGWIEIRTDPKNTAYVVTEGAKKRDTGDDKELDGDFRARTEEERERLRNDAFAALEVKIDDQKQTASNKSRIEELQLSKEKNWDDPYAASKSLRRAFRADRKARQNQEALTEDLKDRMSLGIDLLDETEDDRRRAGFVEFGDFGGETAIIKAKSKPLFAENSALLGLPKQNTKFKSVAETQDRRERLQKELGDNTRAVLDPFLSVDKTSAPFGSIIPAIKWKKSQDVSPPVLLTARNTAFTGLVDYDSE
jgi:coiled-coil domain-containing protein 130